MKAEQAKSIAEEAIRLANEAELKELEPLFNDIKQAASTGKTSIMVEALSPLIRKHLSKHGYTVRPAIKPQKAIRLIGRIRMILPHKSINSDNLNL
ncbi:hypothetical protein HUW51_01010 (plasmid) [Adhaeribacter swui]|uniref:Uncharacterized protein n=1 Tax=Adhaeribacter swui TaxID=2086471 RepID=A0A7G7G2I4_9BACT|nr:hypothetical protein [Adhaeribacter swui]QNF31368.1 hypothetical protein HUW51_01010 [Adhaeribacter swui]